MRGVVLFLEGKKAGAAEAGKEKINVYVCRLSQTGSS